MDDGLGKIKIVQDYFQVANHSEDNSQKNHREDSPPGNSSSAMQHQTKNSLRSRGHLWYGRKLNSAALMFNLFSIRGLPWSSSTVGKEKVELNAAELESLRSEIADLEEREAYLKAQLEHMDEILRSARLTGYLSIRTRRTALPGEPPPVDDTEVDDWLPRFVVLHGSCIFLYLMCTDLSLQDSTLLSDIVEVGALPSFKQEDGETRHSFYILTYQGMRYECSSASKTLVDSWLTALQSDYKMC